MKNACTLSWWFACRIGFTRWSTKICGKYCIEQIEGAEFHTASTAGRHKCWGNPRVARSSCSVLPPQKGSTRRSQIPLWAIRTTIFSKGNSSWTQNGSTWRSQIPLWAMRPTIFSHGIVHVHIVHMCRKDNIFRPRRRNHYNIDRSGNGEKDN